MSIRFECFGMTILKASAVDLNPDNDIPSLLGQGCLRLQLPNDGAICLFMPFESAKEYANAMNACNDREVKREAEKDYVPNENTVHIPVETWRKLNMGVPDASEDTDTNR